jgi:hypothetical protein
MKLTPNLYPLRSSRDRNLNGQLCLYSCIRSETVNDAVPQCCGLRELTRPRALPKQHHLAGRTLFDILSPAATAIVDGKGAL